MRNKVILGINPGSRHLGYALFQGSALRDWGIKAVTGKWSSTKKQKIARVYQCLLDDCQPDYLAIKKLHSARSSPELDEQIAKFMELCNARQIPILEYPIKYLEETILSEKKNKESLVESVYKLHPELFHDFQKATEVNPKTMKEKIRKNEYHTRMFEAVALAHVCFNQLDNH